MHIPKIDRFIPVSPKEAHQLYVYVFHTMDAGSILPAHPGVKKISPPVRAGTPPSRHLFFAGPVNRQVAGQVF
jgi:hypothetical protein